MLLKKDFTFDAAHYLPDYHGKCENLHGHTYFLSITVKGKPGPDGMIVDFKAFDHLVREHILCHLDHQDLNVQFPNPSTENIAQWVYDKMEAICQPNHYRLYEVILSESSTSHIIIRKDA